MKKNVLVVLSATLLIGACSTYTTPRYSINADTNVALKALNASAIGVGSFSGPASFDNSCRAAGPLAPPDGMSHTLEGLCAADSLMGRRSFRQLPSLGTLKPTQEEYNAKQVTQLPGASLQGPRG